MLNPVDKSRIKEFYRRRLRKHGTESALALDWDSNKNQKSRFEILSRIGDLNGKTILDFGCGLGDLYGYLSKRFKKISYVGIDIVPDFVAAARQKYPKAKFELTELSDVENKFDYIFASGSLTFNVDKSKDFYLDLVKQMYDKANIGVGFNMLNKGFYDADRFYMTWDPLEVLEYCKTFAKDVKIIFEYLQGDFTIYLFKK